MKPCYLFLGMKDILVMNFPFAISSFFLFEDLFYNKVISDL